MGSPISVVLSEFTMQVIEQTIIDSPPCPTQFWIRYVDDFLTAIPQDETQSFLNFLN